MVERDRNAGPRSIDPCVRGNRTMHLVQISPAPCVGVGEICTTKWTFLPNHHKQGVHEFIGAFDSSP